MPSTNPSQTIKASTMEPLWWLRLETMNTQVCMSGYSIIGMMATVLYAVCCRQTRCTDLCSLYNKDDRQALLPSLNML